MRYIYSFKKFLMNEEIEHSGDDGFDLLDKFLMKLDVTTTKLKSNLFFDFYRKVVTSKYLSNLEKEASYITQVLMLLRSGTNNKDKKKVVDNLKKIKSSLLIDDDGKSPWISDNNIKLHLSKSDARKIGDLHSELLRIMKYFEVINTNSTKNKPEIQSIPKKEPIEKTEKSADIWIEKELDSGTTETTIGEIESKINIKPDHQIILDMMPDYSNIKASIVNPIGGLGYVGNFKEREINRGKAISTTILFDGIPSSEIFTHELLHYFTIPVLVRYTENPSDFKGSDAETYMKSLMSLAKLVQSNGYSAVNGVSVHNNLNEFAVNITNQDSCNKLKTIKVSTTDGKSTTAYDMLMKITSDYLKSLSNKKDSSDKTITKKSSKGRNQILDFEDKKSNILKYIENVKKGDLSTRLGLGEGFIYSLITNQNPDSNIDKFNKLLKELGYEKDYLVYTNVWTDFVSQPFFKQYYDNGNYYKLPYRAEASGWVQKDINPSLKRKSGNKTFNYYITISKEKSNLSKFMNSISDLHNRLVTLSESTQNPIAFKLINNFVLFVHHNDSLKIFYYDESLKSEIEKIVKDWIKTNKIEIAERTHTHGFDTKDDKGNKSSYGQLLAWEVDKEFMKYIQDNGDKLTDEEYFEWFKNWLPDFIRNVKIKN